MIKTQDYLQSEIPYKLNKLILQLVDKVGQPLDLVFTENTDWNLDQCAIKVNDLIDYLEVFGNLDIESIPRISPQADFQNDNIILTLISIEDFIQNI